MTLTVKECLQLMLEVMNDVVTEKRTMSVSFESEDGDGPFVVSRVYVDGGGVFLESDAAEGKALNLSQLVGELSSLDNDSLVYLQTVDSRRGSEYYEIVDDWEEDEDGSLIHLNKYEEEEEYADLTNDGKNKTVTLEQLMDVLDEIDEETGVVYLQDKNGDLLHVESVTYFDEIILQSFVMEGSASRSQIDLASAGFIKHCLEWDGFEDNEEEVYAAIWAKNAAIFNVTGYKIDDFGDLILRIESR